MLKIYGIEVSPPVNKVRFTANRLELDYEFVKVDLAAGETRTPEYLQLHPAGKVPVITDGDFVLFESDAICRYLASANPSPLYPADLKQRAIVDQWMDFSTVHIGGAMARVFFNQVIYKVLKAERDERSLETGLGFLERFLPLLEQRLVQSPYLAGGTLTLADICLLAHLDPAEVSEIDLTPYPKLSQWRAQLKQEAFYSRCFADYSDIFKV